MEKLRKEELRRAWAEISVSRLKRNVEKCRGLLYPENELMCVVKANCYGHGAKELAPILENECDVRWFAVSNIVEAEELREAGVKGEILILGYTPPEYAPYLSEENIVQAITCFEYAEALSKQAPAGMRVRCHIAIDTGMTRIGLDFSDSVDIAEQICKMSGLSVEGIFTHLSCADSDDPEDINFTRSQIGKIIDVKNGLVGRNIYLKHTHFLNSAAATYHPDRRSTLARFGIMLYGLHPNGSLALPVDLEPVMELKAAVSQVRRVEQGAYISYGRTFKTERETVVAVVTAGYADGYPRQLSGRGEVLIRGKRAPILGRVCMDQMMIDVTGVEGVSVGDTVTLFGRDGGEEITADGLAEIIGTIGYEIVCGISPRVPRILGE